MLKTMRKILVGPISFLILKQRKTNLGVQGHQPAISEQCVNGHCEPSWQVAAAGL